jgi:hypothetical protein
MRNQTRMRVLFELELSIGTNVRQRNTMLLLL